MWTKWLIEQAPVIAVMGIVIVYLYMGYQSLKKEYKELLDKLLAYVEGSTKMHTEINSVMDKVLDKNKTSHKTIIDKIASSAGKLEKSINDLTNAVNEKKKA